MKKQLNAACNNMAGAHRNDIGWKKSDTKAYILYDPIYVSSRTGDIN